MKLNWGTSIVIAFALFMAFILYFVFEVQSDAKYDNELVVEEYYKHDAHFSDEMAALQNAQQLAEMPLVASFPEGIRVSFPKSLAPEKLTGTVSFYRPSAKKLDFTLPLKLSGGMMLIPKNALAGGLWDTTLSWSDGQTRYLVKNEFYLN